ncbi:MAG: GT4 family glycosyltransferase PelF [Rickettsiales bacterium]
MSRPVDVCLILEGTYPYVPGGVSAWTHELIQKHSDLSFHIISILPRDDEPELRYQLPPNVTGITNINLQRLEEGSKLPKAEIKKIFDEMRQPLIRMTTGEATLNDFSRIMEAIAPHRGRIGSKVMLDSEEAWNLTTNMYEASFSESSMLDYFWSWRAVIGSLYSLLSVDLPEAKCYHAMSTGYAGIMASRAKLETGKPVILTEHGIYTNERRIEISSADWLEETASKAMTIDQTRLNLRDLWSQTFGNYSHICYEAVDHIITLFAGNQKAQIADGADESKMRIVPNGIDVERYGAISRKKNDRPTIAMIGRVVPIKDVKTFLRAVATLNQSLPDLRVLILGQTDEDPDYANECRAMVEYFALQDVVTFTGRVNIDDYLPEIDVLAFSSISEAQPLSILEAGACGIPCVATDVGACSEMLLGKPGDDAELGVGGVVVPLSSPQALAQGIYKLLTDSDFYRGCSNAMRLRVAKHYNKDDQHESYKALYAECMKN